MCQINTEVVISQIGTVSDGLIVTMIMKGLPQSYNSFCTIISQADTGKMDFQKFKLSLRSYDETELKGTLIVTTKKMFLKFVSTMVSLVI